MTRDAQIELADGRVAHVRVRPFPDVDRFAEAGWAKFLLAFGALNGLIEEIARLAGWKTVEAGTEPGGEVVWSRRVRGETATANAIEACIADLRAAVASGPTP